MSAPTTEQNATTPSVRPPDRRLVRRGTWSLLVHTRTAVTVSVLVVLALVLAWFALMQGSTPLSHSDLWQILTGGGDESKRPIVLEMRLPRVLAGLAVGAALAVSGSVFQSMSRNALGSPDIIGFLAGAAAAAVIAIIVFDAGPTGVAVAACIGGMATAALVFGLSWRDGTLGGERLILIGIGIAALAQAITTLFLTKTEADVAIAGRVWLTGTLNARTWGQAALVGVAVVVLVPLLFLLTRRLNAMEIGEEIAMQAGVPAGPTRVLAGLAATALVALATAATGPIGFVALAAPHITRSLVRSGTVPVVSSAVLGAVLLTAADVLSQSLPDALEVPVGVTTSVLGGLYLLFMLGRLR